MSYRLQLEAPAPDAVRAVAGERLERARRRLREDHADDPVAAVHGARKDLKKTRALLRLARPCLPAKTYRRENARLRALGRELSGGRDADVMVQTVDGLATRYAGQLPKRQFTTLSRRLASRAAASRSAADMTDVAAALDKAHDRVTGWPMDCSDPRALTPGAKHAYARGRKAFTAALDEPSADRLHDWRKRVKDSWYHHRLLKAAWPTPLKAYADELDELGELLGDDHDLDVLTTLLRDHPDAAPPSVDTDRILELITTRRDELQAQAFRLGRRIYAEKPKAFQRRLRGYVRAARVEPGTTPSP